MSHHKFALVYQGGIANVFEVDHWDEIPECRNAKRILQSDFKEASAFARGLAYIPGVWVKTLACNQAGDIARMVWSTDLENQPYADKLCVVDSCSSQGWRLEAPDQEGLWWLYGEEEFGAMGGHYTGTVPREWELVPVEVRMIGSGERAHLIGVAKGRMINLTPFDREKYRTGYMGMWCKMGLPALPTIQECLNAIPVNNR